ncbi:MULTISPECIES: monovalent cation/H+ antiporter complex subunit F [unclassified Marinobacter]|uniref:monovalent cation/H+ antiporter complex subunit F n=1 Tax=unclassified Marinobacter TaxID=83889 RepID=UPI000BF97C01|nr:MULTISPECIES: monovalent cation/H+ antiporter complex subunit F [unclassified Marinobacter]PFG09417.1 multisubunit sodium/proton antiporter, MrpF subunit [Marinobacter sp. LV10MA510-1]PFG51321.1 multisubunit sodium/proton antiporter, MrpF subunit [Marinobacter sp. LV10R520-4]
MMMLATILLASIAVGLWRVVRGPSRADRLLAVQLFGTTGAAVLLLLAHGQGQPALIEAALVLAVLAAVLSAALVQLLRRSRHD